MIKQGGEECLLAAGNLTSKQAGRVEKRQTSRRAGEGGKEKRKKFGRQTQFHWLSPQGSVISTAKTMCREKWSIR